MKLSFQFNIDKEANFAYWSQLLIGKWSWYFEKENSDLFVSEVKPLAENEQRALDSLRHLLQSGNNQYRWLWDRYAGNPFNNSVEKDTYSSCRAVLNKSFSSVWEKELALLKGWQLELERYSFDSIEPIFKKIGKFLGFSDTASLYSPIRVNLLFSSNYPTGATRPDFNDLMILNVSRVPLEKLSRVIGVVSHEYLHFINTSTNVINELIEKLKKNFSEISSGPTWKYLITETILKSIASHRSNTFLGTSLEFNEEEIEIDRDLSHKKHLSEYSYEFLIRIAASNVLEKTIFYIEAEKTIDQKYILEVIDILEILIKERNG